MRKILIALLLLGLGSALAACTAKGSNLVPPVSQHQIAAPITSMDNGGGPSKGCGDQGCPDPTPTP